MRPLLRPLLAGFLGLTAVAAAGDASAPQAASPPAPAPQAGQQPAPTPEPDVPDFVPSEKVSADDAVSFPTDI